MIVRNFQQPGSTEPGLVSTGSLLRECQKYIERKNLKKTVFSRMATGDPNFMNRLARGDNRGYAVDRALAYMAANP